MMIRKQDVMKAAGSLQVCTGQKPGAEAAVHAVHNIFNDHNTQVVLLIEAGNATAAINRKVMLHKSYYVHIIYTYISNSYNTPAPLFIIEGTEILPEEGTTQGNLTVIAA